MSSRQVSSTALSSWRLRAKADQTVSSFLTVEIIMTKVDHAQLEKLYAVPPFETVTQLLVSIALVRGRLGKGGVPDLESSAVQVLRDWNTGKIAYHTTPPAVHHSMLLRAAHAKAPTGPVAEGSAVRYESEAGQQTGDAAIVKEFAPAFDLGGLMGEADREVFSEIEREAMDVEAGLGEDGEEMPMEEEEEGLDEAWGGLEDYVGLGVLKEDDVAVVEQKRKMTEEQFVPSFPPFLFSLSEVQRLISLLFSSFLSPLQREARTPRLPRHRPSQVQDGGDEPALYARRDGEHGAQQPDLSEEPQGRTQA
jgi:hypothetical protein